MGRPRKEVPSVTLSLRIEAKNRYLGEIAARRAKMSLNRLIEVALEKYSLTTADGSYHDETLWNENPFRRFEILAKQHPELLSIDDEVRWKLIQTDGHLHKGKQIDWAGVEKQWDALTVKVAAAKEEMIADFRRRLRSRSLA